MTHKILILLLGMLLFGFKSAQADPSSEDVSKGKELYLTYGCALCHGKEGRGNGINAQKFNPPPTNFYDPKTYVHGTDEDSIRRAIQYGIKDDNSIMPSFEDIPPDELAKIITFLQSLQKKGK